jgi:ribosome-binding factor A
MASRKKRRGDGPVPLEPGGLDVSADEMFGALERADTKTIQLCRQVEESVSYALAGSRSALLRDLYVVGVEPVRGAALLRVLVAMEGSQNELTDTHEALDRAHGYLRGEVARAIHRKRVPVLHFVVVPPVAGGSEEAEDD